MSQSLPRFLAIDVCYHSEGATAAAIGFDQWADALPCGSWKCHMPEVAEYEAGKFYLRELPCLLAVLKLLPKKPELVIIDGHVWLRPGEPGLGMHLHEATGIPVIGVAKTPFDLSSHAVHVRRGTSQRPLYVTSVGIDQTLAATHIRAMHGAFRLPSLLKRVDQLCREGHSRSSILRS